MTMRPSLWRILSRISEKPGSNPTSPDERSAGSWLPAMGLRLTEWFERWFPDAFALALAGVGIVFAACVAIGSPVIQTAQWFGAGFWDLVPFTMQMTMIIVTGYAVATAPPVYFIIRRMAHVPKNGKSAAAFVALFSMLSSLISWSFSLIFSGLLAREVTHRVKGADYRAVGAAAYLGIGSVWALGLSSSAALIMAAPASLPQSIMQISGVIDRRCPDPHLHANRLLFAPGHRTCTLHRRYGREIRACRNAKRQTGKAWGMA